MDTNALAAAIAQAVIATLNAAGETPAPATSAPAAGRIASPLTRVSGGTGKADTRPETVRYAVATFSMADARTFIASQDVPGYSCTERATYAAADGSTVEGALHGFVTPRAAGVACPGLAGLAKGTACKGTIH